MEKTTLKKNQKAEVKTKTGNKYSYQYIDIAQIHDYLEENKLKYYQYILVFPFGLLKLCASSSSVANPKAINKL